MTKHNFPPRLLRTPEAARFLGLSGRTLEKHRYFGTGPAYIRIGGRVIYQLSELLEWAEQGRRWSTQDDGVDLCPRSKDDQAKR